MSHIFLASSLHTVAQRIAAQLPASVGRNLLFVVTAAENEKDDRSWFDADRQALVDAGFMVTDFTFTSKTVDEVAETLKQYDVICVEGGDTFYLLEQIQKSGSAEVIRQLVANGKVYIGSSAGSIVAGPDIYPLRHLEPPEISTRLADYKGLGLVDMVVFPHWGSEHFKDLYLDRRLEYNYNDKHKYMLLTDNQYLEVMGETLKFVDISR